MMSREAEEGQGFLMPFLPVSVISSSVPCLLTGCFYGPDYFITVQQSKAPGRTDLMLHVAVQMQRMNKLPSLHQMKLNF